MIKGNHVSTLLPYVVLRKIASSSTSGDDRETKDRGHRGGGMGNTINKATADRLVFILRKFI